MRQRLPDHAAVAEDRDPLAGVRGHDPLDASRDARGERLCGLGVGDHVPALLAPQRARERMTLGVDACGTGRPPTRRGGPRAGRDRRGASSSSRAASGAAVSAVRRSGRDVDRVDPLAGEPVGDRLGLLAPGGGELRIGVPVGVELAGSRPSGADCPWRTSRRSVALRGGSEAGLANGSLTDAPSAPASRAAARPGRAARDGAGTRAPWRRSTGPSPASRRRAYRRGPSS